MNHVMKKYFFISVLSVAAFVQCELSAAENVAQVSQAVLSPASIASFTAAASVVWAIKAVQTLYRQKIAASPAKAPVQQPASAIPRQSLGWNNQDVVNNITSFLFPEDAATGLRVVNSSLCGIAADKIAAARTACLADPKLINVSRASDCIALPDNFIAIVRSFGDSSGKHISLLNINMSEQELKMSRIFWNGIDTNETVTAIAALHDGRIAIGLSNGIVQLLNPKSPLDQPVVLWNCGNSHAPINQIVVLENGNIVVRVGCFGHLYALDPNRPGAVPIASLFRLWNKIAAFPGSKILGVDPGGKVLTLWDPAKKADLDLSSIRAVLPTYVEHVTVWPDGGHAVAYEDCLSIEVWMAHNLADSVLLQGFEKPVVYLKELSNGKLISIHKGGEVRLWNPAIEKDKPGHVHIFCPKIHSTKSADRALLTDCQVRLSSFWSEFAGADAQFFVAESSDHRIVLGSSTDHYICVLPTAEYFEEKMNSTQDPRDYQTDGCRVYDSLFGPGSFNKWVLNYIQARQLAVENKNTEKTKDAQGDIVEVKLWEIAEQEIVDVVKYWHKASFVCPTNQSFYEINWQEQVKLIVVMLENVSAKSETLALQEVSCGMKMKDLLPSIKMTLRRINKNNPHHPEYCGGGGAGL